VDKIDGRSSRRRCGLRWENGSLVGSRLFPCNGGNSIDDLIACLCASVSDIHSWESVKIDNSLKFSGIQTGSESHSPSNLWLCSCARAAAALAAGSIDPELRSSRFLGVFGVLVSSP